MGTASGQAWRLCLFAFCYGVYCCDVGLSARPCAHKRWEPGRSTFYNRGLNVSKAQKTRPALTGYLPNYPYVTDNLN